MKKQFDEVAFLKVCEEGREYIEAQKGNAKDVRRHQMDFLMKQLHDNRDTEYGRKYGFADIKTYEDFRDAVPITEYSDYLPYIDRMTYDGETNLISAYPVVHYASSSGSSGKPKRIPVSQQGMEFFSGYGGSAIICHLYDQIRKQGHKPGPVCFLADFHWDELEDGTTFGSLTAHMAYNFRKELDFISTSPEPLQFLKEPFADAPFAKAVFALSQKDTSCLFATFSSAVYEFLHMIETNWEKLVDVIRRGELDPDLSLSDEFREELNGYLSPDPERADELEAEFSKGFDDPIVPRIWPNMSMFCCIGGSFFAEYTKRFKKYSADIPVHMYVYGSSESQIGIPMEVDDVEYTPMVDGVFFEFRSLSDDDDGERTYLLDELEEGKDYEMIITNMSGFYRYRMMDVIRVERYYEECPMVHVAYRLNQIVSMAGEKMTTEHLDSVVREIAVRQGTSITNFALYTDYSSTPGRYILLLEPDEYRGKGDQHDLGPVADDLFQKANSSFKKYRYQKTIGMPLVVYLEPDSFRLYKELQIASGISANQIKPVKLINDKKKKQFFFGLSEGPYNAVRRVLFDVEMELEGMDVLKKENDKLKKELAELREELARLR